MIRGSRNQNAGFFYSVLYMYLHGLCSTIPQCARYFAKICSDSCMGFSNPALVANLLL